MFAVFFGRISISVALTTVEFLDDAEAVFVGMIHRRFGHGIVEMGPTGSGEILVKTIARSADPLQGAASGVDGALILRHGDEVEKRLRLLRVR